MMAMTQLKIVHSPHFCIPQNGLQGFLSLAYPFIHLFINLQNVLSAYDMQTLCWTMAMQ